MSQQSLVQHDTLICLIFALRYFDWKWVYHQSTSFFFSNQQLHTHLELPL